MLGNGRHALFTSISPEVVNELEVLFLCVFSFLLLIVCLLLQDLVVFSRDLSLKPSPWVHGSIKEFN